MTQKELTINSTMTLSNGVEIPRFGFGVYKTQPGREVIDAVTWALEAGYRLVDTASIYKNEEGVGQAIRDAGIPREDLFLTSKVWNSQQGYESTLRACEESLKKLGTAYLDLYLIHWPVKETLLETWRAMEKLYRDGLCRAIGLSNFLANHLEELLPHAEIPPALDQVEFHPRLQQPSLQDYLRRKNIRIQAWSPLMRGRVGEVPELVRLGEKYERSPAQITIRWMLQKEILTIPKSVTKSRIRENAQVFDFFLEADDVKLIDGLDTNTRVGSDPNNFRFDNMVL